MNDYIEKALRTESVDLFKVDCPRVLHAAIGVNTEIGELLLATDETNMIEEIGDVLWYMAILANVIDATFEELEMLGKIQIEADDLDLLDVKVLFEHSSKMLDLVKRGLFYGIPTDLLQVSRCAGIVLCWLRRALEDDHYTVEEAMGANIAKLARRYPDKFTSEAAVDRDHLAELEVLKETLQ